jgi:Arc/MetJ-type ribon-helix-helix transcriptional regulator
MKTIHLTDRLEQFLGEMVHSGRYASEESVISDALDQLRRSISPSESKTAGSAERDEPGKPLTKQRFQRHLVEIGVLDEAGGAARDERDPSMIDDEGEVLSELLIRERLIEWLAGFIGK